MTFWDRILSASQRLSSASYYEVLGVQPDAGPVEIASKYYALVARLHPDRHARERDPERREALTRLFARIGDAYRVLTDPGLRRAYDQALARGEVTLAPESRAARAAAPERDPSTELGRQLLEKGLGRLEVGDARGARGHLELAARYEPDSRAISAALARARGEVSGARPAPAAKPAGPDSEPAPAPSERPAPPARAEPPPAPPARPPTEPPPARAHPRVPANVRIKLKLPTWDRYEAFRTRDLSRGGMFVRAKQPLARGTVVRLQLASPDGQAVEMRAQVVRTVAAGEGAGMGLRFLEVSEETRRQVDAILAIEGAAESPAPQPSRSERIIQEEAERVGLSLRDVEPPEPRLHVRERVPSRPLLAEDLFDEAVTAPAPPSDHPLYVPGESEAREGRELLAAGEYVRAAEVLEAAVTARPDDDRSRVALHVARAYVAERAGRHVDARAHYEAALEVDPQCAEAIAGLRRR